MAKRMNPSGEFICPRNSKPTECHKTLRVVRFCLDHGFTSKEIAAMVSVEEGTLRHIYIPLAKKTDDFPEVIAAVDAGKISINKALKITRGKDWLRQEEHAPEGYKPFLVTNSAAQEATRKQKARRLVSFLVGEGFLPTSKLVEKMDKVSPTVLSSLFGRRTKQSFAQFCTKTLAPYVGQEFTINGANHKLVKDNIGSILLFRKEVQDPQLNLF